MGNLDNQLLVTLTQLSDFIGMAISLWLMFYLLARGHSNPLTIRMAIILLALSLRFYDGFENTVLQVITPESNPAFAVVLAVAAGHNLTYQLLPSELRARHRFIAIGIIIFAVIAILNLLIADPRQLTQPEQFYFLTNRTPHLLVDLFDLTAAIAIFYNLSQLVKSKSAILNSTFYASLFFGLSTIAFGTTAILFQITVPRYIPNFLLIIAFILLGYSIARYQSLVDNRVSIGDFPIIAFTFLLISIIYAYAATRWGLSIPNAALLVFLAIASHAAYDLIREYLHRAFSLHEQSVRRELRQLTRNTLPQSLPASLRRSLAILCHNLDATSGFIALQNGDSYIVSASYHAMPVGASLQINHPVEEELFQPSGDLAERAEWLCRFFSGNQPVGVVAIGKRAEMRIYTESDLGWLEDVADQVGSIVQAHNLALPTTPPLETSLSTLELQSGLLLSTLALQPNPDLIKSVEEGFRHLNDYIQLGDSPLTHMLSVTGNTHIDRGKAVQQKLIGTIQSLRPPGDPPSEPFPREWYSFTILYDAYVEEIPDRDIMSKLYISEGTFYRTRRKALRGVSRALMEAEALA